MQIESALQRAVNNTENETDTNHNLHSKKHNNMAKKINHGSIIFMLKPL